MQEGMRCMLVCPFSSSFLQLVIPLPLSCLSIHLQSLNEAFRSAITITCASEERAACAELCVCVCVPVAPLYCVPPASTAGGDMLYAA